MNSFHQLNRILKLAKFVCIWKIRIVSSICCTDEFWSDKNGNSCEAYINNLWCLDGGYGPNWNPDWGVFQDYSGEYGKSAAQRCCACGLISGNSYQFCSEEEYTWKDYMQNDCQDYLEKDYCFEGIVGNSWNNEAWGSFKNVTDNFGLSAADMCCGCMVSNSEAFKNRKCNTYGYSTSILTCSDFQDRCENGIYNLLGHNNLERHEDPSTGLRPQEACCGCIPSFSPYFVSQYCSEAYVTSRDIYSDKLGYSCSDYLENQWCLNGTYGVNYPIQWGSMNSEIANSCCGCINSYNQFYISYGCEGYMDYVTPTENFIDSNWVDYDTGMSCLDYTSKTNNPSGTNIQCTDGVLKGLAPTYALVPQHNNLSAVDVCCGCIPIFSPSYITMNCLDYPDIEILSQWEDSKGRTCNDYITLQLCEGGTYGPSWNYDWGFFSDFSYTSGYHAGEVCCECISKFSPIYGILNCEHFFPSSYAESEIDPVTALTCRYYSSRQTCDVPHNNVTGKSAGVHNLYYNTSSESYISNVTLNPANTCCSCISETSIEYVNRNCLGFHSEWRDSNERTCQAYSDRKWCENGEIGDLWSNSWGDFSIFADINGNDAGDECCECISYSSATYKIKCLNLTLYRDEVLYIDSGFDFSYVSDLPQSHFIMSQYYISGFLFGLWILFYIFSFFLKSNDPAYVSSKSRSKSISKSQSSKLKPGGGSKTTSTKPTTTGLLIETRGIRDRKHSKFKRINSKCCGILNLFDVCNLFIILFICARGIESFGYLSIISGNVILGAATNLLATYCIFQPIFTIVWASCCLFLIELLRGDGKQDYIARRFDRRYFLHEYLLYYVLGRVDIRMVLVIDKISFLSIWVLLLYVCVRNLRSLKKSNRINPTPKSGIQSQIKEQILKYFSSTVIWGSCFLLFSLISDLHYLYFHNPNQYSMAISNLLSDLYLLALTMNFLDILYAAQILQWQTISMLKKKKEHGKSTTIDHGSMSSLHVSGYLRTVITGMKSRMHNTRTMNSERDDRDHTAMFIVGSAGGHHSTKKHFTSKGAWNGRTLINIKGTTESSSTTRNKSKKTSVSPNKNNEKTTSRAKE